ncbi:MAG: hypothetical protein ACLRRG_00985 [Barnesiella sp.]
MSVDFYSITTMQQLTKRLINSLYKRYRKPPGNYQELGAEIIFLPYVDLYKISFSGDIMTLACLNCENPFYRVRLKNICGIEILEKHIALVMSSSILFLNRENNGISVHIKEESFPFYKRIIWTIQSWFHRM